VDQRKCDIFREKDANNDNVAIRSEAVKAQTHWICREGTWKARGVLTFSTFRPGDYHVSESSKFRAFEKQGFQQQIEPRSGQHITHGMVQ
jgi:hypothetical protein